MVHHIGNPHAFLLAPLVLVVAAFLWWALRRRRASLAAFAGREVAAGELMRGVARRLRWKAGLLVAATAALVLAYAEPRFGVSRGKMRWRGTNIVVLVDVSRSMLATDVRPMRLERAKLEIKDLLAAARGDRVALVTFAGRAFVHCPLTLDYNAFAMFLDDLTPAMIPVGGTAVGKAIRKSLEAFGGETGGERIIILISDGEDHGPDALEAARDAARMGVRIVTCGIGSLQGSLIPLTDEEGQLVYLKDSEGRAVKSSLNETLLVDLAEVTGGRYIPAYSGKIGLDEFYRRELAGGKGKLLESAARRRYDNRYQWPLALVIVLLVLEPMILEVGREERA